MSPEIRAGINTRLGDHLEVLRDIHLGVVDRASKYLLGINGGGVVATLSFMGAMHELRGNQLAWWVLGLFLLGVTLCGLLIAVDYHSAKRSMTLWVAEWKRYVAGEIHSQDVGENLEKSIATLQWVAPLIGYLAFASFVAGSAVAIFGLHP